MSENFIGTEKRGSGIEIETEVEDKAIADDTDKTHLYKMKYDDLKKLNDKLWKMPLPERKKITGLHPQRADVIITGASIIQVVMEVLKKDTLIVSVVNLVEGVLYE